MAGAVSSNPIWQAGKKKKPSPVEDMYKIYNTSVEKQAGDYDEIMGKYRNVFDEAGRPDQYGGKLGQYDPVLAKYTKSQDTTDALASLKDLSQTGGLSGADQQNLRARGISPIRAMYATAQRDMDRKRNLAGGYSPNYGAVTSRMTRDQSSLIADQMDKVNAGIAEMVQRGKLSAAPQYADAAQAESELMNKFEFANQGAQNEARRFNATNLFDMERQRRGDKLGAAQGMTNLYGTTPALSNLYGKQAMDTAQFQNDVNVNKKKTGLSALGGMIR